MFEDSLRIVELRQFAFCPRIPWYNVNNFSPIPENSWMRQGEEYHLDREKLLKKRLLKRFKTLDHNIRYRVNVYSVTYGIHGIVDALIETKDEIFPIEFKLQKGSFSKGIKNQILGYALCLEEMSQKKVSKGFIVSGRNAKVQEIFISEKEKLEIVETINKVKQIREMGLLPDSPASAAKCSQCEFLNYCNDREF
ncbi:MAG: CRISPR-associated protein Cas4 [Leptospiraceae bacterium]|nr:CRISPR-associated protein Cas4 [Leptospiraceae bacterium]